MRCLQALTSMDVKADPYTSKIPGLNPPASDLQSTVSDQCEGPDDSDSDYKPSGSEEYE
jgi:hypothetical protein